MATVSNEIAFDENFGNNALYNVTDTSAYGGTDLTWIQADGRCLLKVVDPLGNTIYENTDKNNPDMSGGGNSMAQPLPTDADGNIIMGSYVVTLTNFDVGTPSNEFERTHTLVLEYAQPTIDLDVTYSVINPFYLKIVDNTNYDYNNYVRTVGTETITLYNPPLIGGSQSVSGNTLNTNSFYTTTSTVRRETVMYYDMNGYYNDAPSVNVEKAYFVSITTDEEIFILDSNSVADYYCCVHGAWEKQMNSRVNHLSDYDINYKNWMEAEANWFGLKQSYECDMTANASGYAAEIERITKCTVTCASDTTPRQVFGIGTTSEVTGKYVYTATSNITNHILTDLIGMSWVNGDFMVFVDGNELETDGGTASFDTTTGQINFGMTVYTGTEYYIQVIKR